MPLVDNFLSYPAARPSLRQQEEIHQCARHIRLCFIFLQTSVSHFVITEDPLDD